MTFPRTGFWICRWLSGTHAVSSCKKEVMKLPSRPVAAVAAALTLALGVGVTVLVTQHDNPSGVAVTQIMGPPSPSPSASAAVPPSPSPLSTVQPSPTPTPTTTTPDAVTDRAVAPAGRKDLRGTDSTTTKPRATTKKPRT